MGVHALRCDTAKDLPAAMKEFMEYDNSKPVLLEARVVKNEHVFPMVPAGKALHQQIIRALPPPLPFLARVDAHFSCNVRQIHT
jgi:acetolactate synthase-1/2/3 large subunit